MTFRTQGGKCRRMNTEALGLGTPNPRCQGPSDSDMPQDDMGILLKDGLFVDLGKGPRICIFTNTCDHRTKPRSAGFYSRLCLANSY